MSAPELVTVTIDDREVQVPKGTGLVETGLVAGLEIPVFCYEPRLGPPVGACRMCLVEVDGMPKLQTACTMTAQDGLVVRTAQTSEKAAEGQSATLEFLLVNHPLDCPVCDKGGECPLQDLTFRYGPGNTRMTFPKVTLDKPIPISPHIALDRERCILCYRCTRFSEAVAEDGELVAVNRGRMSMIATFEDEPYRDRFSGNVIELCPVGALTSTEYRFQARPWEIHDVPTVCGLCPVGCNVSVTTREGKAKRILSRNHPEIDQGWLCDKGRFAFPALRAPDRVVDPLRRVRRRRLDPLSWDEALDELSSQLREAGSNALLVLSGTESNEIAYALARIVAAVGGGVRVPDPDAAPLGRPLSDLARAGSVRVAGDVPLEELAPVAELWVKQARRAGADGEPLELRLPRTPNGLGVREAVARAGAKASNSLLQGPPALLFVSGDEAAADPAVRELAEGAGSVVATAMFSEPLRGWVDLVVPGTWYLERDGSTTNLEGRVQRLRRVVIPPAPDELAWLAELGARLGVELSPHAPVLYEELFGEPFASLGETAPLRPPNDPRPGSTTSEVKKPRGLRLVRYRPLFSGPTVERVANLQFQRPDGSVELSREDAHRLGIRDGDDVVVRTNGTAARLRARLRRRLERGIVLLPEGTADELEPGPVVLSAPEEAKGQ